MRNQTEVVIIGAGPTGLSMAIELNRFGIPFRIFDKKMKPVPTSNALAVQTRTLEIWDEWGLLPKALEQGIQLHGANVFSKAKLIGQITFKYLQSPFHYLLSLAQHDTEAMLLDYLTHKDVTVEMEVTLEDLISAHQTVDVFVRHANGNSEKITANWIIACDGGHSWVREKLQVPFLGQELPQHFVLADFEIFSPLSEDKLNMFMTPKGVLAIIQFDEKYSRLIADTTFDPDLKKATTLTFEQIKRLIRERCPFNLEIGEPIWTSGFWIHERLAKTFQASRVFFAGDAAHVHSPIGGQGMNTGIQDANNLAWKLSAVIQKIVRPAILQTYELERQAVVKKVLSRTTFLTKVMTTPSRFWQFVRNNIMSIIFHSKNMMSQLTNTLTQLNIQYPENVLVKNVLKKSSGPEAGTRMLDIEMEHGYLSHLVKGLQFTVFCFMGETNAADIAVYYDFKHTIEKKYQFKLSFVLINTKNEFVDWDGEKVFDKDSRIHKLYGAEKPCMYVIRPDRYIGYRGGLNDLYYLREWLNQICLSNSNG